MPSYIGTSIENKPAYMKRNETLHRQIHEQKANFVPTIEQARVFIDKWLEFKHSQKCTNDIDKTIQEVINETEASVEENAIETEGMIDEEVEETNPDETEDEGETIVSE